MVAPELLDLSVLLSLVNLFFFSECEHLFIDKSMVTTEAAIESARAIRSGFRNYILATYRARSTRVVLASCRVFLECASEKKKTLCCQRGRVHILYGSFFRQPKPRPYWEVIPN